MSHRSTSKSLAKYSYGFSIGVAVFHLFLQLYSQIVRVKYQSTLSRSSCYHRHWTIGVAAMASCAAAVIVLGRWRHLQGSASTSVYSISVVRRWIQLCIVARDSLVSSRTNQPTKTSTSAVTTLTDNQLCTCQSQTKSTSYSRLVNKLWGTSSSLCEVNILFMNEWIFLFSGSSAHRNKQKNRQTNANYIYKLQHTSSDDMTIKNWS